MTYKTPHLVWAISIAVGSWTAGWIACAGRAALGLAVIAGILTGIIIAGATAIVVAGVMTLDDVLVERAQRPAPKHARRRR